MKAFIKHRTPQEDLQVKSEEVIKKDKTSAVLQHLKVKGSITSMEAFQLYGATRLSAIIFNLKKRGYEFKTTTEVCTDRFGHPCSFARYTLIEE